MRIGLVHSLFSFVFMHHPQPNNPLHGITLKEIVAALVDIYGWEGLAKDIPVKCFTNNPSIKSSLVFLRKESWARAKVEDLYVQTFGK